MSAPSYLIAGINGRFGTLFARRLAQTGARVSGMDLQAEPADPAFRDTYLRGSVTELDAAGERALAAADHVLLCVPESTVVTCLPRVAAIMREDGLLIDVASVKSRIQDAFSQLDTPVGYLSIHPMFAPSVDFSGRAVCIVPLRDNPRAQRFAALLEQWGARLRVLSAREHDAATAIVQALPHAALIAFGATLAAGGVSFDTMWSVATPIQKLLLALTARVAGGEPETYWSIQAANPAAAAVREALATQLGSLSSAVSKGDAERFGSALERIRGYLGAFEGDLQQLAAACVAQSAE